MRNFETHHLSCAHGPEEDVSRQWSHKGPITRVGLGKRKKRHIVMWCMRKGSRRGTRTKRHDKNWAWIRVPRRRQQRGGKRTSGGLTLSNLLVYFQFSTRVRTTFSASSFALLSCY